ncbi:MAG: 4-demethylwyosine synthase TYW1 [Candidatus Bilamarchaeaceae archaeon]
MTVEEQRLQRFINAQYRLAGKHSAVQICSWTKKALRGEGFCYKQKFYGIDCHRCSQISPAFIWCQQSCVHCWRPAEWMKKNDFDKIELDKPETIIEEIVKQRKKLLTGFGGAKNIKKELYEEAYSLFPSHWAISLSGEPTIYPYIDRLIKALKKHKEVRSIFLVTNGQEPNILRKLIKNKSLPTQLYISLTAWNEKSFKKLNKSTYENGWKRLLSSLKMLKKMKCRTVIRLTLIKGINDSKEAKENFARLFEMAQPTFIEIKAYMFLGESRKRLKKENMPSHEDVKKYANDILALLHSYRYEDEDEKSRIVLLKNKKTKIKNYIQRE